MMQLQRRKKDCPLLSFPKKKAFAKGHEAWVCHMRYREFGRTITKREQKLHTKVHKTANNIRKTMVNFPLQRELFPNRKSIGGHPVFLEQKICHNLCWIADDNS